MEIKVIKNINEFKNSEKSWNSLYNTINERSVFQSFEFNYYSWIYQLNNNRNTLALVIVYNEGKIIAVFPFYIDNNKRLRFINDNHADFCDYLSVEIFDLVLVLKKLKEHFLINSFNFINLMHDARILLCSKVSTYSKLYEYTAEYSVLELNQGIFPENFINYKSKQKTEFRRVLKKNIDRGHEVFSSDNNPFPRKEINKLRDKMIALGIRNSSFLPLNQLLLIEKLYQNRKIILSIVKDQKTINAISFIIKDSDRYLIWIDLYDNSKMINIFNYISLMTVLSSNNAVIINFGRGGYGYKISNFLPKVMYLSSFHIFNSKWQELKFYFLRFVKELLKSIYKKIK